MNRNWPTLGIRFDIGKIESGNYGWVCWQVFWKIVDIQRLRGSLLFDGDTQATLRGQENVYCIAVQSMNANLFRALRLSLEENSEFRTIAASPAIIEGGQVVDEPLVMSGGVDEAGNLRGSGVAQQAFEAVKAARPVSLASNPSLSSAPEVVSPVSNTPQGPSIAYPTSTANGAPVAQPQWAWSQPPLASTERPLNERIVGFWRRLAAYVLDTLVVSVLVFVAFVIIAIVVPKPSDETIGRIMFLLMVGVPLIYTVAFWTARGQTPGKMAVGIKIVKTDGSPLNLGSALLRCFGYFISSIVLCLGFLWIGWDYLKQGWHDKIANTYVVSVR